MLQTMDTASKPHPFNDSKLSAEQRSEAMDARAPRPQRRVQIYCNGDRFFKGKIVHLNLNRYRNFNDLLSDLTGKLPNSLHLAYGVRQIFTPVTGRKIRNVSQMQDGQEFVCAGFETFKPMKYGSDAVMESWSFGKSRGGDLPVFNETRSSPPTFGGTNAFHPQRYLRQKPTTSRRHMTIRTGIWGMHATSTDAFTKPKVVTIIRSGAKPRPNVKILLNRHSVQSFDQFVRDISEAFGPKWTGNRLRKFYSLKGREIHSINDFFRDDDIFIGIGNEDASLSDVQEIIEQLYPDTPYAGLLMRKWEMAQKRRYRQLRMNRRFDAFEEDQDEIKTESNRENEKRDDEEEIRKSKEIEKHFNEDDGYIGGTLSAEEPNTVKEEVEAVVRKGDSSSRMKNVEKTKQRRKKVQEEEEEKERIQCMEDERKKELEKEKEAQLQIHIRRKPQIRLKPITVDTSREREEINLNSSRDGDGEKNEIKSVREHKSSRRPSHPDISPNDMISRGRNGLPVLKDKNELNSERQHQNDTDRENEVANEKKLNDLSDNFRILSSHSRKNEVVKVNLKKYEDKTDKTKRKEELEAAAARLRADNSLDVSISKSTTKKKKRSKPIVYKTKLERQISNTEHVMDQYELGKVLGDGNFAVVKYCKQKRTDKEYAMKVIDKSKLRGKEGMIENEIMLMKICDHPNIVKLFEEYETKTEIFLVMELVKGGDLFDAITQSVKFSETETAKMVFDLAQALFYLHSRSIVHRDLKPENILVHQGVDGERSLKLADFGLAMEVHSLIYTVCGTPTYVAPEILSEIGYGLEIDMWALGVIMYILLCGFPPFRSADRRQTELFEFIKSGEFEFLSPYWDKNSDRAKALINHLLIVDRKKRFTAIDVLCDPFIITFANSKPCPDVDLISKTLRRDLDQKTNLNREKYRIQMMKRRL